MECAPLGFSCSLHHPPACFLRIDWQASPSAEPHREWDSRTLPGGMRDIRSGFRRGLPCLDSPRWAWLSGDAAWSWVGRRKSWLSESAPTASTCANQKYRGLRAAGSHCRAVNGYSGLPSSSTCRWASYWRARAGLAPSHISRYPPRMPSRHICKQRHPVMCMNRYRDLMPRHSWLGSYPRQMSCVRN